MLHVPMTRRRTTLTSLVAAAAVGAMAFLPNSPASAAPPVRVPLAALSGELVHNGGAEDGDTSGWTGDIVYRTYGAGGFPNAVVLPLPGTPIPDAGTQFFSGIGAASQAYQDIDLTAAASAIDNGVVVADLSAYLGGFTDQEDHGEVIFEFFNASNAVVDTIVLPAVTKEDRESASGFLHRADTLTLDAGVRSARVTFSAVRSVAPVSDSYVDNISLQLFAPGPEAIADTATTVQDEPKTLSPADNDVPPPGATIVPASLRLLDGGNPVTSLTNSDGTYTVNTGNGDVMFTPAPGYTGTAAPVDYRIEDSNGQPADSIITITVGPVIGASLINGPVALGALGALGLLVAVGAMFLVRRRMVNA
jgi:CshA-type fibril repeat protein